MTLTPFWDALLAAEQAVDATTGLTRCRTSGFVEEAHVEVSRQGVSIVCAVRGVHAKGRGARMMTQVEGTGESCDQALRSFRDRLATWVAVLNA